MREDGTGHGTYREPVAIVHVKVTYVDAILRLNDGQEVHLEDGICDVVVFVGTLARVRVSFTVHGGGMKLTSRKMWVPQRPQKYR